MATTRSDTRTKIYNRLSLSPNDSRLPAAPVNDSIDDAIREFSRWYEWPWLKNETTIAIVANTVSYAKPTNTKLIMRISYLDDDLEYLSIREFVAYTHTDNTGRPTVWTIENEQIVFAPKPTESYTFDILYTVHPTVPETDGANLEIPDHYLDVIIDMAASKCCVTLNDAERKRLLDRDIATKRAELTDEHLEYKGPSLVKARSDWRP